MQLVSHKGNNNLTKTIEEYIHSFTDLTEKAMEVDPANIMNRMMIFLFIKNLYNKDIRRRRFPGVKVINTIADSFKLAHQSLFKQMKYEGLLNNQ